MNKSSCSVYLIFCFFIIPCGFVCATQQNTVIAAYIAEYSNNNLPETRDDVIIKDARRSLGAHVINIFSKLVDDKLVKNDYENLDAHKVNDVATVYVPKIQDKILKEAFFKKLQNGLFEKKPKTTIEVVDAIANLFARPVIYLDG